jgi:hypothetical protein
MNVFSAFWLSKVSPSILGSDVIDPPAVFPHPRPINSGRPVRGQCAPS